jgi:glucose-6-phosphate isomerase
MLSKTDPRSTPAWKMLESQAQKIRSARIKEFFTNDPARAEKLTTQLEEIYFDYSRNLVDDETLGALYRLAGECHLKEAIESFFAGDPINETEKRSVLHTALRNFGTDPVLCAGEDVMPEVRASLNKIKKFCNDVHKGHHKGYNGKSIRYIVNIGIGGSDLGPRMVVEALRPYQVEGIETFFVSNVDGQEISEVLKKIKPERTLFLVVSKTFTTQETMRNAQTARKWFLEKAKREKHISRHFVAVSTNETAAQEFGIPKDRIFRFRDWVGGRFSLWSPVGLSIALSVGYKRFEELLRGAYAADEHFRRAEPEHNIPVILGLLGIWNTNFLACHTEAILPYDQRLARFPAYLQQASMESNGKSTDRGGEAVEYSTAPVTWGEPGTNGQHAFFQLLHQGTQLVPCDFILCANPHHGLELHHQLLVSNCLAQAEALMTGKSESQVQSELEARELTPPEIAALLPFKTFTGNRPSSLFLIKKLTPYNLGCLLALYEHKIFVQGVIWNIYSFDQWGVELGKQLADRILPHLTDAVDQRIDDQSTSNLIRQYKIWRH